MLGNGDSDPPARTDTDIAHFADPLRETLAQAEQLLPSAETVLHAPGATPAQIAARIVAFLDA